MRIVPRLQVSIFYFGYLLGTYPSIYLMQKLHIGRFIAVMTFCWGVAILGMLGIENFAGLMVCRFLLGLFESCLSPGFLAITTRWYRQQEQPFRFALWVREIPKIIPWSEQRTNFMHIRRP